jgi:superfamily II helicase
LNDKFRSILRSPEFPYKLGLVAIDELHVVAEQERWLKRENEDHSERM